MYYNRIHTDKQVSCYDIIYHIVDIGRNVMRKFVREMWLIKPLLFLDLIICKKRGIDRMEFEDLGAIRKNKNETANVLDTVYNPEVFSNLSTLPSCMLTWIDQYKQDVIIVWDNEGKVLFISKSIERLLGYKPSDLIEMHWHEKIPSEEVNYIRKNLDQSSSKNQTFTINILNSNGKYIWSECTIAKILDEESDQIYFISSLKDISDKKEAEEMLIHSEKMSIAGQLAAGIAHEIRNPLTSLKGFLQLLQAGINRKEEYYNIMLDEIEKMETITSELLFIAKPLTDNKKMESVNKMIGDIVVLLQPQANLKNIELIFHSMNNEQVYCDRSQIKQVLINLVKNAIEAMETSGTIKIVVLSDEEFVKINVIDEGAGIPEEIIQKLGEPFFTTKNNGTGLGIMISKQILGQHQASLKIMRNKEQGSTFQIIFPK